MKKITVSVSDDVYRKARIRAAELGTSLSALVAEFLNSLSEREMRFARLEAKQRRMLTEIRDFRAGDRLSRNEVHARDEAAKHD